MIWPSRACRILTLLVLAGPHVMAQAPTTISYQGYLEQGGVSYPDGTISSLTFKLYEYPDVGESVWAETHTDVPIANGIFNVDLGSTTPIPSFAFTLPPFLGITVEGDAELTPRTPLTAAPAAQALVAGARADGTTNRILEVIHRNGGYPNGYGVWSETLQPDGTAIQGFHTPASGFGTGVKGISTSPAGTGGVFQGGVGAKIGSIYNTEDLILLGYSGNDDGVISTDPASGSSDLILTSNDDVVVTLDANGGESGVLTVRGGTTDRFRVHENGTVTTWGRGQVVLNSTTGDPHLLLQENENGDYARLRLRNTSNTRFWDVAAGDAGNDRLNFFRDGVGDIMTIRSSGRVGIMTLSPGFTLEVNGSAGKPGGGSWSVASDARWKTVDGAYDRGLKHVLQLEPVRYHYRPNNPRGFSPDPQHIGFVAQQVQQAIPEAVDEQDGYLYVNNDPILWAMVNAIQQLHAENERLASDNERLRLQIAAIADHLGVPLADAPSQHRSSKIPVSGDRASE